MEQYSVVIFLLAISIALSVVASKVKIPYPILLLAAGIAVGFIPGLQRISITPEVVFLIFLPPMLYDAAFNISFKEFKANIPTISTLAVSLVFITTTGIAVVAHYFIPGMTWPLAFVLGAILSPPDAAAATGVIKGLTLSHKTKTILEGESLVNDASALIAYRFAVAAVAGASFIPWKAGLEFLFVLAGGFVVGMVLWFLFAALLKKIRMDGTVHVSLKLLMPFVAYLFAEKLHVSGVIAVVTVGLCIAWHKDLFFSQETNAQSKSVWDTMIFLLNGLIFILIGLEFPHLLENMEGKLAWMLTGCAFLLFFTALIIRVAIIFRHKLQTDKRLPSIHRVGTDKKFLPFGRRRRNLIKKRVHNGFIPLNWKDSLIIGWSGMRGIVSLAAALALPLTLSDGTLFPQRDVILFLTVEVVVIMLIVQGLGLPLLIRWLKVEKK